MVKLVIFAHISLSLTIYALIYTYIYIYIFIGYRQHSAVYNLGKDRYCTGSNPEA
jgi:hypothetical protein